MEYRAWKQSTRSESPLVRYRAFIEGHPSPSELLPWSDYLAYPLLHLVRLPSTRKDAALGIADRHREQAVLALHALLTRVDLSSADVYRQISLSLLRCCSDGVANSVGSEEMKLAIVQLLAALVRKRDFAKEWRSSERTARLALAHWITLLLEWSEKESNLLLKEACAQMLDSLLVVVDDANVLVNFLPGVSTSMVKGMVMDAKKSARFLLACFQCLETTMALVLSDDRNMEALNGESTDTAKEVERPRTSDRTRLPAIERSPQWLQQTRPHLVKLMQHLTQFRMHSDARVREAVIEFSLESLRKCFRSFGVEVSVLLLDSLILLGMDDEPAVQEHASKAFQQLLQDFEHDSTIVLALQEEFQRKIHAFPSKMNSVDDDLRTDTALLLSGYMRVLGKNSMVVLHMNMDAFMESLLVILTPDTSNIHLVSDRHCLGKPLLPPDANTDKATPTSTTMLFVHFRSTRLESALMKLVRCLVTDAMDGVRSLVALLLDTDSRRASRWRCLLEIIPLVHDMNILDSLLDEFLDARVRLQPTSALENLRPNGTTIPLSEYGRAVVEIRLGLRGVAAIARRKQARFQRNLISTLIPLLELVGHPNQWISQEAWNAIQTIADGCTYESVEALLVHNVDYVVDAVTNRVHRFDPSAPHLLLAVFTAIRTTGLSYFVDCVEQLTEWLADPFIDREMVEETLRVFERIVELCGQLFSKEEIQRIQNKKSMLREQVEEMYGVKIPVDVWESSSEEMRALSIQMLEERRLHDESQQDVDGNKKPPKASMEEIRDFFDAARKQQPEDEPSTTDQASPPIPPELRPLVRMTESALNCAQHFLASDRPEIRSLVLRMILGGSIVLAREVSVLLAFLNRNWDSLVARLQDREVFVVLNALTLFNRCMELCGDFLARRFQESLLPAYVQAMSKYRNTNVAEIRKPEYHFSVGYRVQHAVMVSMQVAIQHGCLSAPASKTVLVVVVPLLEKDRQSPGLYETSKRLMSHLATRYPDSVELYLREHKPSVLQEPWLSQVLLERKVTSDIGR